VRDSGLVIVGKIIKAFGLRGELKVHPEVFLENFREFKTFIVFLPRGGKRVFEVDYMRQGAGESLILKLKDINDRDAAEILRGRFLYVEKEKLAEKAEGEYYLFELMDMQVIEGGKVKGRVIDFILSGTNLVLVLEMEGKEILVPFVKEYIKSVNTDSREMVVEIPSDLKELNQ